MQWIPRQTPLYIGKSEAIDYYYWLLSCDLLDRKRHMWKIRPNFSHLYSPKISHVKYPTEYIKRDKFNRMLHRCEQLDLIRHSYDIFDRIHHMWKIRPYFSHLYSPIMSRVKYTTDYVKREDFDDILHGCEKNRPFSYKLWHIGQKTSHVKKSDRISHTFIHRKCVTCLTSDQI